MSAYRQWQTNPFNNIEKAKVRALRALTDPSVKLTKLEQAFFDKYKEKQIKDAA